MNLVTCGTIRIIREGSDREEASRVSKHLFVDDSRQHVMLSRNPPGFINAAMHLRLYRPPECQSVICQ